MEFLKIVKVLLVLNVLGLSFTGCSSNGSSSRNDSTVSSASSHDECGTAMNLIQQASTSYENGEYSRGYNAANRAVELTHTCPSSQWKTAVGGAALSARAWNERHLAQGDSMNDITLAYALLKTCIDDSDMPSQLLQFCRSTAGMDSNVTATW